MTKKKRAEILKTCKAFAEPFYETFGGINETGFLIVDPLSGYLNSIGIVNKLHEIPENEKHCQVLIMTFEGGDQLIPAGADLKPLNNAFKNWMWL